MSAGWVIDASIAISWVHPGQATAETEKLLEAVESGVLFTVPSLWFLEVANTLFVLQRRRRITRLDRELALKSLGELNVTTDDERSIIAFHVISRLAEKESLSVYDSA